MKVSEKGAVSIYGMGRFPVTLYKEQWLKLLDMSTEGAVFSKKRFSKSRVKPLRSEPASREDLPRRVLLRPAGLATYAPIRRRPHR
jgi:hypothetical protein